ncbi:MAG: GGDEF domain-containing protein [Acidobacteriota bacterium]
MRDDDQTNIHSIETRLSGMANATACVVILSCSNQLLVGRLLRLEKPTVVIGRDELADFQVVDDGISRRHVRLEREPDGGWRLHDLGSTNGTFVNGHKTRQQRLNDGDRIQIGRSTVLKFGVQDQIEESYQRSLYERATRDGLTGLYNKKFFLDALVPAVASSVRHGTPLSLLMLDIDHFKRINDTFGHPAGDTVLREVSQVLTRIVRAEDVLARYGGEEFALLLRETDQERAEACAERCRGAVETQLFDPSSLRIRVTLSAGVASLPDRELLDVDALLGASDRELYEAKRLGRNRVCSRARSAALA